jgi:hypothetical protein
MTAFNSESTDRPRFSMIIKGRVATMVVSCVTRAGAIHIRVGREVCGAQTEGDGRRRVQPKLRER